MHEEEICCFCLPATTCLSAESLGLWAGWVDVLAWWGFADNLDLICQSPKLVWQPSAPNDAIFCVLSLFALQTAAAAYSGQTPVSVARARVATVIKPKATTMQTIIDKR